MIRFRSSNPNHCRDHGSRRALLRVLRQLRDVRRARRRRRALQRRP